MKCPECEKENKKSTVQLGSCTTTLMYAPSGYFNEDGVWSAIPDPNTTFQEYRCSNGHEWTESYKEGKLIDVREPDKIIRYHNLKEK